MSGVPARVISGHRITIPQEHREKYDLSEGDWIRVSVEKLQKKDSD